MSLEPAMAMAAVLAELAEEERCGSYMSQVVLVFTEYIAE